ncbi:MAG: recombinase RecT [Thermoanaerobacter sp.]|nr:recombinase RecT [Thermoanaerobacter sp.]
MSANTTSANTLALLKKDTVDVVAAKIRQFQQSGELHLPANYSAENAMKSAWLILQSTVDKNGKPALEVCTKDSIANALLDMVVQGLNPAKKQCYFIVYGNKLVCQRSYFGSMHVIKEVAGAKDIYASVVYKGDEFEYEIKRGKKHVLKHVQKIENVSNDNIIAAYCVIEFEDGREYTEIMTIDQIKQAWRQSQLYKDNGNGTHQKFTDQMAMKTVINRACKAYINSSNDSHLFLRSFNRSNEIITEEEVAQEIAENANGEIIDIEGGTVTEEEPVEQAPPPPPKEKQPPKDQETLFPPTGTDGGPPF